MLVPPLPSKGAFSSMLEPAFVFFLVRRPEAALLMPSELRGPQLCCFCWPAPTTLSDADLFLHDHVDCLVDPR